MKPVTLVIAAAIGAAMYYGCWHFLISIGFSPLWASLMVIAIAVLLSAICILMIEKAADNASR